MVTGDVQDGMWNDEGPRSLIAESGPSRTELSLHLLGGFRVGPSGQVLHESDWGQRRTAKALVKLLAVEPTHAVHREQILEALWPNMDAGAASNSFSKALHAARRALEPDLLPRATSAYLTLTQDVLTLTMEHVWIDVDHFQRLAEAALQQDTAYAYETALAAYTGDLLPEDRYEDWTIQRRDALANLYVRLLFGLSQSLERQSAYAEAVQVLRKILEREPTREDVSRRLMRLLAETGSRHEALRHYQVCQAVLRQELDVDPEPETQELYREILANRIRRPASRADIASGAHVTRPLQDIWTALSTPLIGRERVLERLMGEMARAEEGDGGMVLISGEVGVGKTRLTAELLNRAAHRGALVLWGSSDGNETALPYGPFAVTLEAYISGRPLSEREELAQLYPDLVRLVPSLQTDARIRPLPATASREERSQLFPAIVRFLTDLASTRVVLLAIGDLHAADPASLQLLHYLARLAVQRRWFLVGTYREEDMEPGSELQRTLTSVVRERFCRQIELRPLARHDSARLVQALLPDGTVEEALIDQIYSQSLGNPLFIEELIGAMRDRGEVALADGRWYLASAGTVRVPRQVRNLVQLRVADLDENVQRVLALAAAAGSEFSFAQLRAGAACLRPPLAHTALFEALDRALGARILQETEEGYTFRHPLVRAALVEHLSKHHRAELRAALAQPRDQFPDHRKLDAAATSASQSDCYGTVPTTPPEAARFYGELVDRLDAQGRHADSASARQKLAAALTGMGKYHRAQHVLAQAAEAFEVAGDYDGLKRVRSQIELISFLQGGQSVETPRTVWPLGFPSSDAS